MKRVFRTEAQTMQWLLLILCAGLYWIGYRNVKRSLYDDDDRKRRNDRAMAKAMGWRDDD